MGGGEVSDLEYRVVRPDGTIRHVWSAQGDRVTDAQGNVVRLSGIVQDVTDRKQVGEQLRLQSSALNAAAHAMVITDLSGRIQWINPAFSHLTGYTAGEAIGSDPHDLVYSGRQEAAFYRSMWDTILAGKVWHGELINRRKDGSLYTEEQTITPVPDITGAITHFIGIKQDVSARKRAEDALRKSEASLALAQAVAHVGSWEFDTTTRDGIWSEEMRRLIGSDPEEPATADRLLDLIHPDDRTMAIGMAKSVMATSGPVDIEVRSRPAADGSVRYFLGHCDVVRDATGKIVKWVGTLRDITQERSVQKQLQRQERLAAVGQLAAGIAHDFNNIVSVIVLYAQMTAATPGLTENARARVGIIEQQAMRAAEMIRQILDFSRRSVLERTPLDLLPVIKEQITLLERTLPENIQITLNYGPERYVIAADVTRMQQIVVNLALNARDAMPDGGQLCLALDLVPAGADGLVPLPGMESRTWVRLRVADTGMGIERDVLDHIFEPFFTTKGSGGGTGFGLAQVHGIIGQHGGHITVESKPGVGTEFTIYLPALALVLADAPLLPGIESLAHGHGELVLLVEDDDALRTTLVDLLTLWHYRVRAASNGEEALAQLAHADGVIDLIITDAVMPKRSGIGLVREFRRLGLTTPAILVTGHAIALGGEGFKGLGFDAWLPKPVSAQRLAEEINRLLHATALN